MSTVQTVKKNILGKLPQSDFKSKLRSKLSTGWLTNMSLLQIGFPEVDLPVDWKLILNTNSKVIYLRKEYLFKPVQKLLMFY